MQPLTHFLKVSMASLKNRSLAVAGDFSSFALMSSSAALFIASRNRATSSSAKESKTSSLFLRFFGREDFLLLRMASICMLSRILLANEEDWISGGESKLLQNIYLALAEAHSNRYPRMRSFSSL